MRWTSFAVPCLLATAIVGCKARPATNRDTGALPSMTDTASMSGSAATPAPDRVDSAAPPNATSAYPTDTNGATRKDTSMKSKGTDAAQTQSGVTDAKTGKSTLGPGIKKARPDQGKPVTSKGDTISKDSSNTAR
jgi:hypothetical protein